MVDQGGAGLGVLKWDSVMVWERGMQPDQEMIQNRLWDQGRAAGGSEWV